MKKQMEPSEEQRTKKAQEREASADVLEGAGPQPVRTEKRKMEAKAEDVRLDKMERVTRQRYKNRKPTRWEQGTIVARRYRILRKTGHGTYSTCYLASSSSSACTTSSSIPSSSGLEEKEEGEGDYRPVGGIKGKGETTQELEKARQHLVAIKVLHESCTKTHRKALDLEAQILKSLPPHDGIIHLMRQFEDPCMLVLEWCENGSLRDHYKRRGGRAEGVSTRAKSWLYQVLKAIQHLHAHGIIHRDVKAGNVLLSSSLDKVKLTDFGLSCYTTDAKACKKMCGTPNYVAPEVLRRKYDCRADMWSFGVLCYYVFTGYCPFSRPSSYSLTKKKGKGDTIYNRILRFQYRMPSYVETTRGGALIRALLVKREQRPDSVECERHIYFTEMVSPRQDPLRGGGSSLDHTL